MTPEEKLRAQGEMSERLKSLNENDAFQYLKEIISKKRKLLVDSLAARILSGEEVMQRMIDYERGYWDGAMHVLNRPENAEAAFLKALKRLEGEQTE